MYRARKGSGLVRDPRGKDFQAAQATLVRGGDPPHHSLRSPSSELEVAIRERDDAVARLHAREEDLDIMTSELRRAWEKAIQEANNAQAAFDVKNAEISKRTDEHQQTLATTQAVNRKLDAYCSGLASALERTESQLRLTRAGVKHLSTARTALHRGQTRPA